MNLVGPTLDRIAFRALLNSSTVDWLNSSASSSGWNPKCWNEDVSIDIDLWKSSYLHSIFAVSILSHVYSFGNNWQLLWKMIVVIFAWFLSFIECKEKAKRIIWSQIVLYCHFHLGRRGTMFEREWIEGCALCRAKRRPICFKLLSASNGGLWLRAFDHLVEPWHQKFSILLRGRDRERRICNVHHVSIFHLKSVIVVV